MWRMFFEAGKGDSLDVSVAGEGQHGEDALLAMGKDAGSRIQYSVP